MEKKRKRLGRQICLEKHSRLSWHRISLIVDGINKTIIVSTSGSSAFLELKGQRSLSAMVLDSKVHIRAEVRTFNLSLLSPRDGPCFFWIPLTLFLAFTRTAMCAQDPPHRPGHTQAQTRSPLGLKGSQTLSPHWGHSVPKSQGSNLLLFSVLPANPSSYILVPVQTNWYSMSQKPYQNNDPRATLHQHGHRNPPLSG